MKNIDIKSVDYWDQEFFEDFADFKNKIYDDSSLYMEESVDDLRQVLESSYFKLQNIKYKAILFKMDNTIIARVVCYFDPNFPDFCNFGHFEILKQYSLQSFVIKEINQFALKYNVKQIRGPIQGNFFFSYRFKLEGDFRFYGEPHHQEFYPEIFYNWGFRCPKKWYTEKILHKSGTSEKFKKIRDASVKKNKKYKYSTKFIFPWRWDSYIDSIHELFVESYKDMPEFSPIDKETFKSMYGNFKYIINPFLSYLMFYKGKPIAFTITFFDPLRIIFSYQERSKKVSNKWLKLIDKILLLIRLKLNGGNLLIMYSGKIKGPKGEEFKGIQAAASRYISIFFYLFRGKDAYVCYLGEDSPAYSSFSQSNQKPISTYGVFYKKLDKVSYQ